MPLLPHWKDALKRIGNFHADNKRVPLKIVLKTKDENLLLQDWIDHHAGIVGLENLVILDNLSTDHVVMDIYQRYTQSFPIGFYEGFVDTPHNSTVFALLYEWLSTTSDFYIFLDTDERLIWAENEAYFCDASVIERLKAFTDTLAFPGTWLYNQPGSRIQFRFGSESGLVDNMRWGKPIVSTKAIRPTTVLHNCQISDLFIGAATNFFVLHLSQLSVIQRVRANINKLRSHGLISSNDTGDEVHKIDISKITRPELIRLIEETKNLIKIGEYPKMNDKTTPHSIIMDTGTISFNDDEQRMLFLNFLDFPDKYVRRCKKPNRN